MARFPPTKKDLHNVKLQNSKEESICICWHKVLLYSGLWEEIMKRKESKRNYIQSEWKTVIPKDPWFTLPIYRYHCVAATENGHWRMRRAERDALSRILVSKSTALRLGADSTFKLFTQPLWKQNESLGEQFSFILKWG